MNINLNNNGLTQHEHPSADAFENRRISVNQTIKYCTNRIERIQELLSRKTSMKDGKLNKLVSRQRAAEKELRNAQYELELLEVQRTSK